MNTGSWINEFFGAITVCDAQGVILEMNDQSVETFAEYGGRDLVGSNLLDCHPEPSRSKLKNIMEQQQRNVYTVEKKGQHKIVIQSPWFHEGMYGGFVEMVIDIPEQMPHFVRG